MLIRRNDEPSSLPWQVMYRIFYAVGHPPIGPEGAGRFVQSVGMAAFEIIGPRQHEVPAVGELGAAAVTIFPELAALVAVAEDWTIWGVAFRYPSAEGPPEPGPDNEELQRALATIDVLTAQLRSKQPREAGVGPRGAP